MNKNIGIVVAVIIVLIAGGIFAMSSNRNNEKVMMEKKAIMEKEAMMKSEEMKADSMMKRDDTEDKMMKDDSMMKKPEAMMKNDTMIKSDVMVKGDVMMKAGAYVPYSADKISMASAERDVVLFFRASWCPSCRTVDADIKTNLGKIPSNLTILDVDYDNSAELKKKYGVTYQHTFVQVDKDGNLITKWSGGSTLSSIVEKVK